MGQKMSELKVLHPLSLVEEQKNKGGGVREQDDMHSSPFLGP